MGFVGFLRFCLLCIDFLAWPTFALVYPLWASIRAIETGSKHHMKKLVTYWTIFSLISLFEIFFFKLIEWVPLWPYIKLVAICWLVIPQFDGACHVYQHLIHPCLSFNSQDVVNWFSIPKEKPHSEDSFLASAETYLKENGPEALEKLIASKAKQKEQICIDADADALEVVKSVEPTEKNVTVEEQLVEHPKPHFVESEEEEITAAEAEKVTTPAEKEEKIPLEAHAPKNVQREWTCAMCQVTTSSEETLNSHLQGRKHRSKCENLKTSAQTAKKMQSSAAKDKSKEPKTSGQTSKDSKPSTMKTNTNPNEAKNNAKTFVPGEGSKQNTTQKPKNTHTSAASGKQIPEKPKKTNAWVIDQESKLWCGICNIRCSGEIDMACHLNGRKHIDQESKLWCGICNIRCSREIDMACHLNGRKHLLNMQIAGQDFIPTGGGQV